MLKFMHKVARLALTFNHMFNLVILVTLSVFVRVQESSAWIPLRLDELTIYV